MEPLNVCALHFDQQLRHEWIATNGIGGYASSTMLGCNTRKYHGLLVASMLPPVRRMVMLSRVEETVYYDGWPHALACNEYPDTVHPQGQKLLRAFSHDPFPRWGYQHEGWTVEKQLRMLRGENTVVLSYALLGAQKPVELEVRPLFAMRGFHELMYQWNGPLAPQATFRVFGGSPSTTPSSRSSAVARCRSMRWAKRLTRKIGLDFAMVPSSMPLVNAASRTGSHACSPTRIRSRSFRRRLARSRSCTN